MKYPTIATTAEVFAIRGSRAAASINLTEAWQFALRHWGVLAAIAITFAVHAPTLRYFFNGDDFVVLGNIEYAGTQQYLRDTFFMRDVVPNWRPLTAVVYAVEWQLFGLNAAGWRAVNLTVHLASVAVLYALIARVTQRQAIGAIAALVFGVSGAHFDTVTYITALPHVLATFFVLSSLLAIVSYAQDGERNPGAFWLSFALFVLAFLSNEGAFVYAPVIVAAYVLYSRRWRMSPLRAPVHAAPFAALATGWLWFYQACSCEQLKFEGYSWGTHVIDNYAVYLSWIAFPAQSVPLAPSDGRWMLAAAVVGVLLYFALNGPHLARLAVLGIALALLPFVPVEIWTASRYSYAAVAFFAPLVAITAYAGYERVRGMHTYARIPATLAGIALVAIVGGLYGWQSHAQDARSGRATERWELLVSELQRNYDDVPDGTMIYIVDGMWSNPMEQYTWVPSVARALYGDASAADLPRAQYQQEPPATEGALFLEWTAFGLVPIEPHQVLIVP